MIIHETRYGYFTGTSREIGPRDPFPPGWTVAALPDPVPGKYAVLINNEFRLVNTPPVEPEAVVPPEEVKPYRPIDKVEAMAMLRMFTNMTLEQELAFRKNEEGSPMLDLFWLQWNNDVGTVIQRDNPMTTAILDGLVAMGKLTNDQKQMMLDNWPREQ